MSEEEERTSSQGAFISTQVRGNRGPLGNSKSGNKLKNALTAPLEHNTISVLLIPSWNWLPNYYGSQSPGSVSFYAGAVSEKLHLFGFAILDVEKKSDVLKKSRTGYKFLPASLAGRVICLWTALHWWMLQFGVTPLFEG